MSNLIILEERGYNPALYGLGLSREVTSDISYTKFLFSEKYDQMQKLANKLSNKDGGHNKFLESIQVWIDIRFPRYWWQQFDTYRIGVTKQSESTMYNILKHPFSQKDFESKINGKVLSYLEELRINKDWDSLKSHLPESYLQKRIVNINYKSLRNIIIQRKTHKLKEWKFFVSEILKQLEYPYLMKE